MTASIDLRTVPAPAAIDAAARDCPGRQLTGAPAPATRGPDDGLGPGGRGPGAATPPPSRRALRAEVPVPRPADRLRRPGGDRLRRRGGGGAVVAAGWRLRAGPPMLGRAGWSEGPARGAAGRP